MKEISNACDLDVPFNLRAWCHLLLAVCGMALMGETAAQSTYEPYKFTTLAGLPRGNVDGTVNSARFSFPMGIALDNAGNLYLADYGSHTVRKVTPGGVVVTVAGSPGVRGSADGSGSAARFNYPSAIAVDTAGNLFVADSGNNTIRKITPAGLVTTFAGLAITPGSADGSGTAARFSYPTGIAVDAADNLFVADGLNYTIRKITPDGIVTTFAGRAGVNGSGDGTGDAVRFNYPTGIAVDSAGNVYVGDSDNQTIRQITPAGLVTTLAGLAGAIGDSNGSGDAARFNEPAGVSVDSTGNIYVCDAENDTIRKVTPEGLVTTLAGLAGNFGSADGTGSSARLNYPQGVVVDKTGSLYVADTENATIRRITQAGTVTTFAGLASPGSADGTGNSAHFEQPYGLALDGAGNSYVTDRNNHSIRKLTPDGTVTTVAGLAGSPGSVDGLGSAARFKYPTAIALDDAGNLYVADTGNSAIRRITKSGAVSTIAGIAGSPGSADGSGGVAQFYSPRGIAVDTRGDVYVADTNNHTIRLITPDRMVTTLAGVAGLRGSNNGTGGEARFYGPSGIALDTAGNLYVADAFNDTIRKVTSAGGVTTLAGVALQAGSVDGTGASARFRTPGGVSLDSAGNIYVAEIENNTVRKVTPAGVVTTLAGVAGLTGNLDGVGDAVRFFNPTAIGVSNTGKIYVADKSNNTIRVGVPTTPLSNIATRVAVGTDANVAIGGFIITGTAPKQVVIRGIGPSLTNSGIQGPLADPTLELYRGAAIIATNDNWKIDDLTGQSQEAAIAATTIPPTNDKEAAILITLQPGAYTAILSGKGGGAGVGLVEVYSLASVAESEIDNISTRGLVQTGDSVIIGGFIVGGSGSQTLNVLIRAIGPSLTSAGVTNALADPTLELHDGNGALLAANDNWRSDQEVEIQATGIPPTNEEEAAILRTLTPGSYTAIVRGKDNTTGIGLVEIYRLQ